MVRPDDDQAIARYGTPSTVATVGRLHPRPFGHENDRGLMRKPIPATAP
jgi:hypothetical protein